MNLWRHEKKQEREWRMRGDVHEIKEKKMRRRGKIDNNVKQRIERLEQGERRK